MKEKLFQKLREAKGGPVRVHPSLDDLVRLQFEAHGFTFLPKQPVHSLLSAVASPAAMAFKTWLRVASASAVNGRSGRPSPGI